MSKLKFLIVSGFSESLVNFRFDLIISLISAGYEVHAAAPDFYSNPTVVKKLESVGVVVHPIKLDRIGFNPFKDLLSIISLYFLMRSIKPDVFFGYTVKPVIFGSFSAWLSGVPRRFALISGLGRFFEKSNSFDFIYYVIKYLYLYALDLVDLVFFQNPDDEAFFISSRIINPYDNKTCVVNGSGVNVSHFNFTLLPKEIRFLMVSRFLKSKGLREYFQAADIVHKIHPNVRFGLVGWSDSSKFSISESELQCFRSQSYADFYGRLDDVRNVIKACSVFVLPSYYPEGTPRTVLEAMSMGRPIITTDAPGCRETVVDGYNGFLVPVKAVDELVVAMLKCVENPDLIQHMGECSRTMAEEKYDVNKVNEHMLTKMGIM